MPLYNELEGDQRKAVCDLLMRGIDQRIKEESHYTTELYRFLTLANGAGLALLASFINGLVSRGQPVSLLAAPSWKFFLGAVIAVLILVPLSGVANQATIHAGNQFSSFIMNKLPTENMISYGLNKTGRLVVLTMAVASISLFLWGVIQSMSVIKAL